MNGKTDQSRWIEEILTGERDPQDPETLRRLQANPQASVEIEELSDLARLLDDAGREQRDTIDDAQEASSAPGQSLPGSDLVAPHLERLIRERTPSLNTAQPGSNLHRRPIGPRRLLPILAAAAIFLLALPFAWNALRGPERQTNGNDHILLGDTTFDLRVETDETSGQEFLRWSYTLSPGGWFSLEIRGASASEDSPALVMIPRCTANEWKPTEDLPLVVSVRITAHDASGEVEASRSSKLSLSR